jgi:hypothetical protein
VVWAKGSPYLKTREQRPGGVAYVIEYLPSKCEAQNSNPCTAKKKKKKKCPLHSTHVKHWWYVLSELLLFLFSYFSDTGV